MQSAMELSGRLGRIFIPGFIYSAAHRPIQSPHQPHFNLALSAPATIVVLAPSVFLATPPPRQQLLLAKGSMSSGKVFWLC